MQQQGKGNYSMTKFQEFMTSQGLTQYRLHKLTGFTKTQISEWQHGKHRPSLKSAHRLAVALRMSIQLLKSQIELRECGQNARTPDGQFVARSQQNSRALAETNDPTRTAPAYCLLCHQMIRKAA
jgi:transcriptional regulator with XRE-family HTH domain